MTKLFLLLGLTLSVGLSPVLASETPHVFVSILPQRTFVEHISGDLVEVSVMVMPGASPATYEPTPRQMTTLTKARAYFAIGVPFERAWLPRITSVNPDMDVIHTDQGIEKRPMAAHEHHSGAVRDDHEAPHGHQGEERGQRQGGIRDPHVWLAPDLVKVLARNIHDGLVRIDPAHRDAYAHNLDRFLDEIDRLDQTLSTIIARFPEDQRSFMVFHPAWGYFADQYGLHQIPIESQGKEPSPKQLVDIVKHGRDKGISVVFVQPQFSDASAGVIAREMGAEVVPLDPLAEDWAENLLRAARAFERALE